MNLVQFKKSAVPEISLIQAQYKNHAFKAHYHLDFHIGLISKGQQIFNYQGSKHQVGPGFVQVMMPGQVHDSQTLKQGSFSTKIFSLPSVWLTNLNQALNNQHDIPSLQHCFEDNALYQQLITLHDLLKSEQTFKLAADSLTVDIFTRLLERYGNTAPLETVAIGTKKLTLLKEYLLAHLNQRIQLKDLASLCELSESQLLRQFKKQTGLTPYAWLARLRLEQALQLLKSGLASTQVAYQVGFYDQAHFIKAFHQAYGLTPSLVQNA